MNKSSSDFNQRCYELLLTIPADKVTTYKEMAGALNTKAWRAVGSAMAKNPNLISVPCHRVVRSNGEIGEYASGSDRKMDLLITEGIEISHGKVVNLQKVLHQF